MPTYQMVFDTQGGEVGDDVTIDPDEVLREVLPEILIQLEAYGYVLQGWREGAGEPVCKWEGRKLDENLPLPDQGVRDNDILRVSISRPSLQLRRENELYDIVQRVELREGDDIVIGRTLLRFHVSRQQRAINKTHTFIQRVQQGRSFQQTVYYMALVGGIAGLSCWFLVSLLRSAFSFSLSTLDPITYALLGVFVGGLSVGFNDHWLGDRVVARWVLMGMLAGALAGAAGGLLSLFIETPSPLLTTMLAWLSAGTLIGGSISLRWLRANKTRVLHGLIGGLFGGMLGGMAYSLLLGKVWVGFSEALGLMLVGVGITCGISLAPILLRQGVLEFLSSRDPVVIKKYAQNRRQWEIHEGGKYVIGSLSAAHTETMFGPEVQIFIPDQLVAPRHAILTARERKYYLEPHHELTMPRVSGARARRGGDR